MQFDQNATAIIARYANQCPFRLEQKFIADSVVEAAGDVDR